MKIQPKKYARWPVGRTLMRMIFTVRHMRFKQVLMFLIRRFLPAKTVKLSLAEPPQTREYFSLFNPIEARSFSTDGQAFEFLNHPCELVDSFGDFEWQPESVSRLWTYNLHYFEYLRSGTLSNQVKHQLINSWIDSNVQNKGAGWEPYTCSRRIVNWIFFIAHKPDFATRKVLVSLYTQVLWLEANDEQHILANHYFENLRALLFAGKYFVGDDAKRWKNHASTKIASQLVEQTLDDGGHYERSALYHAKMLENYLDIFNVIDSNPDDGIKRLRLLLCGVIESALCWLNRVTYPDKSLPLFNDSSNCEASTYQELYEYWVSLNQGSGTSSRNKCSDSLSPISLIDLPDSGFYGVRSSDSMLLIDCGEIGPGYQPGHTHCDLLSYEFVRDKKKIIVNSGVYEYGPGATRALNRATQSHNSVVVNGLEQSELWGEFRVAQRAKKHTAVIEITGGRVSFLGEFSGFYGNAWSYLPSFSHRRIIEADVRKDKVSCLSVNDQFFSLRKGRPHVGNAIDLVGFLHFHPDIILRYGATSDVVEIFMDDKHIGFFQGTDGMHLRIEDWNYHHKFGLSESCHRISMCNIESGQGSMSYKVKFFK